MMLDDPIVTIIAFLVIVFSFMWAVKRNNSGDLNCSKTYNGSERDAMVNLTSALVRWTAALAIATAVGGTFLYAQYRELHQASIDTGRLVRTARDTERRQLRAYIGILDGELRCTSCEQIRTGALKAPAPGYRDSDMVWLTVQNGGQTPAYDVAVYLFTKEMPFGEQLPLDFKYPDYPLSTDEPPVSHVMANPGEKPQCGIELSQDIITQFVRAQNNLVTIYIYGHADYKDIFGRCFTLRPHMRGV